MIEKTDIESTYEEFKKSVTPDFLKKITADIISAYRKRDFLSIRKYIGVLKLDRKTGNEKLFSVLIRTYHPDRHAYIHKKADELFSAGMHEEFLNFCCIYSAGRSEESEQAEEKFTFTAEYRYGREDFGYGETGMFDEEQVETDYEDEKFGLGFLEALNRYYFGGLEYDISESDLHNLDGELDLSDYNITDLDGIEKCIYLEELNLSGNRIEKTGRLSALVNLVSLFMSSNEIERIDAFEGMKELKILDISFNGISDISVLENLGSLEYVNLIGNPVSDFSVIETLVSRGVIVIFEENVLR